NLTANMLGLGNAATPLGIRAMEELQELNPKKDTATNSMVMLLALNTASVQLVPPTLLVAVMGIGVNELVLPIIVVTVFSAIVAVTAANLLSKTRRNRASDPSRQGAVAPEEG
ncbi:MAG TPA: nucleoside recognition protein, partial [Rhodothermales bacterium]